jgi:anti-sigma regulatory factor (Ser/Thr protein kinase)
MEQSRLVLLRGYLFVGGIILIALLMLYAGELARKVKAEAESVSLVFAHFAAMTASTATGDDDPRVGQSYREVINRINFPLILTDRKDRPRVWRHVGVGLDEVTDHEIETLDPKAPPVSGPMATLLVRVKELDAQNRPIPIQREGFGEPFGYVHYGQSPLVRELRLFPLVELTIVVVFILLAVLGYRSVKLSEQRSVWVGMAKETAHQLGTPISSLMGWLEVLRERVGGGEAGRAQIDRAFLDDLLDEMENDTARLEKIAARFSNVGSVPHLQVQDIVPIVAEAVRYLARRLPQMGARVEIQEQYDEVPPVNVNRELMEWVVENLLKNALDAVDQEKGQIQVEVRREPQTESVDVRISDNGRGMTPREQHDVFTPGYSTKRRGWGLGLSLSRRIVEEYHGGRLFLAHSAPSAGSTFVIRFPL